MRWICFCSVSGGDRGVEHGDTLGTVRELTGVVSLPGCRGGGARSLGMAREAVACAILGICGPDYYVFTDHTADIIL